MAAIIGFLLEEKATCTNLFAPLRGQFVCLNSSQKRYFPPGMLVMIPSQPQGEGRSNEAYLMEKVKSSSPATERECRGSPVARPTPLSLHTGGTSAVAPDPS